MGLRVDQVTGAVVTDESGVPLDDGMLPLPVPAQPPVVQPTAADLMNQAAMDPAAMQNAIAGFEAQQAQAAPPVAPLDEQAAQFDANGQTPEEMAAIAAQARDAVAGPPDQRGGASVSTGSRFGYSPEQMAKMRKDPLFLAQAQSWEDAATRADQDAAGQLAAGAATADAAQEAERLRFAAENAELDAQRVAAEDHARAMETERRAHEQRLAARNVAADEARQRYMSDAAAARAMVVDPSLPYRGAQGALGTMALMGQAWLANMGPGSPVMPDVQGMIDRIVQDNISAQSSNRANAWKTAESSDNIWNLAREGVDEEVMAHQRYRGFLTEAYQTAVAVNAAKFAGGRAAAAHQSAMDAIVATNQQYADQVRTTWYDRLSAIDDDRAKALENMRNNASLERRASIGAYAPNLNAKTAAKKAAAEEPPPWAGAGDPIYDARGNLTGILKFTDDVQAATKVEATEAKNLLAAMEAPGASALRTLNDLRGEYKGKLSELGDNAEAVAKLKSAHALLFGITRDIQGTGAALTGGPGGEKSQIDNAIPIGTDFQEFMGLFVGTPDYERMLAQGLKLTRDMLARKFDAYNVTPDAASIAWAKKYKPVRTTDAGFDAATKVTADNETPKTTPVEDSTQTSFGTDKNGKRDARDFLPRDGGSFHAIAKASGKLAPRTPGPVGSWNGDPMDPEGAWQAIMLKAADDGMLEAIAERRLNSDGSVWDSMTDPNPTGVKSTSKVNRDKIPAYLSEQFDQYRAAYNGDQQAYSALEQAATGGTDQPEPAWTAAFFYGRLLNRGSLGGSGPTSEAAE